MRDGSQRNTAISVLDMGTPIEVGDVLVPDHCRVLYMEFPPGATPLPQPQSRPLLTCEVTLDYVDGALVPTEFAVIGSKEKPITAQGFREVRVQEIVDATITTAAAILERQRGRASALMSEEQHEEIGSQALGRRRLTTSLLHQVANVARNNPDQPTKQVAEQLYTSHRNATRWIAEARRRGFLITDPGEGEDE